MVNQDYMRVQEKMDAIIAPTILEKCARVWNKFFEIEHESKEFKIFFAVFMGTLISGALISAYLILSSGTFNAY